MLTHEQLGALRAEFSDLKQRVTDLENKVNELTDSVVDMAAAKVPAEKPRSGRGD